MTANIIGYRRVSTKQQGASGLGLEAQQAAIEAYAKQTGAKIIATYTEIESGKRSDRPELAKALAHARRSKAALVVAKLDRLSRNVAFLSSIMEAGTEFAACDYPNASKLTLHIMIAVAENEAEMISKRTKAALQAYKARGNALGAELPQCRNLTQEAREKGAQAAAEAHRKAAAAAYTDILPTMVSDRTAGRTLQEIADRLNGEGHSTRTGKPWTAGTVYSVLSRVAPVAA